MGKMYRRWDKFEVQDVIARYLSGEDVQAIAEEDARVRAGIALCKAVCGGRNGCTDLGCKMLPSYLKHYDNE